MAKVVKFYWIPDHCKIQDNERAEKLANNDAYHASKQLSIMKSSNNFTY